MPADALVDSRQMQQMTHCAMGTIMTHKAQGVYADECLKAVRTEIARIEAMLSRFLPNSEVSEINASAGLGSRRVSSVTYEILAKAVEYARGFPGCFDPTVAPLTSLWTRARESSATPDRANIRQVLRLVNYRDLQLDPWARTAGLRRAGQAIDLGGIGKGFAADRMLAIFRQYEITSAYSNLGGNVVTFGARPDGTPWRIGIQHPRQELGLIGAVSVTNETVVTSGDYQRCYTDAAGLTHHHILDPETGYPAHSGLISVSVVADSSLAADALSTILFVAGLEKSIIYLRTLPQTEAVLVDRECTVHVTRGIHDRFVAADGTKVLVLET